MRKRHTKRVVLGAAAMSLLFAGSAFTASNSMPDPHALGYGSVDVSGATVTQMEYTNNEDGSKITELAVAFEPVHDAEYAYVKYTNEEGDVSPEWVSASINDDAASFDGLEWETKEVATVHLVVTSDANYDGTLTVARSTGGDGGSPE